MHEPERLAKAADNFTSHIHSARHLRVMNSLFRPEAVAHNTKRLAGEVLLAAPLPAKVVGVTLSGLVLAAALFAGFASYARTATLSGWLIPDKGLIRAAAPATGLIQSVLVSEGEVVPQGRRLAEIALSAETKEGNAGESHARSLQEETMALKAHKAAAVARLNAEVGADAYKAFAFRTRTQRGGDASFIPGAAAEARSDPGGRRRGAWPEGNAVRARCRAAAVCGAGDRA